MVIPKTCPNLSNIVHTDFELGRVTQTVGAADPGIPVVAFSLRIKGAGELADAADGSKHAGRSPLKTRIYAR